MASRLHSLLALSLAVPTLGAAKIFNGGPGDGYADESLPSTTLNGQNLAVIYGGSGGDGFDLEKLNSTTLVGQNLAVIYSGKAGDGFDLEALNSTTLVGQNLAVIFSGKTGDGFDLETLNSTTLAGQNLAVIFSGNGGDGYDAVQLRSTTLSGESLASLFGGGRGDGSDLETLPSTTLSGQSLASVYGGGRGDGYDAFLTFGITLDGMGLTDTDLDGIPDFWENLYPELDFKDPSDALIDSDGDGRSNIEEYLADTDPGNRSSYFYARIEEKVGGGYRVIYNSSVKRYYRLQVSTDLNWLPTVIAPRRGTGFEMSEDLPDTERAFGRIQVRVSP
ncbi:MAG: hypothetical protein AAGJ79_09070 [Verrucomicrobiota bacterium]